MTRNPEPVPDTPNMPLAASAEHIDTHTERVVVRRSPRYLRLIVLGAGVGAVGAFFAAVLREPADGYSQTQVFGFLLIFGVVFGGALGILVALLLDKVAGRRQRTLIANKLTVQASEPQAGEPQAVDVPGGEPAIGATAPETDRDRPAL